MSLFLLFLSHINFNSLQAQELDTLFNQLNRTQIDFMIIKDPFIKFSIEGRSDDTLYFRLKKLSIKYLVFDICKNTRNEIQVFDTKHIIAIYHDTTRDYLDLNMGRSSDVYTFVFNNRNYYCIIAGGTGLFNSGSFQRTRFFILIDVTDKKNVLFYEIWTRNRSIFSIGDFNNDGVLDFLQLTGDLEDGPTKIIPHTIVNDKLVPMLKDEKEYYIIIKERENGKIEIIEKRWF
jgi:hypothetical protein